MTTDKMSDEQKQEIVKSVGEQMKEEIEGLDKHLLPLLKLYVESLRETRMTIGTEVRTIIQTMGTLREMTKQTDELIAFGKALTSISSVLTPSFIEKLERLVEKK